VVLGKHFDINDSVNPNVQDYAGPNLQKAKQLPQSQIFLTIQKLLKTCKMP